MSVTFPVDFLGTDLEIPTLARVVPEFRQHSETPLLIGVSPDTFHRSCGIYEKYLEGKSPNYQPSPCGYRIVLNTLELRHKQIKDDNVGLLPCQTERQRLFRQVIQLF